MKRLVWTIALLCGAVLLLRAQPTDSVPELTLKLGALSLVDPVLPSLNLMGEVRLRERWSVQLEGGIILNVDDVFDGLRTGRKSGVRLRPALRYYPQNYRKRLFMELLLVYRQVDMDIEGDFLIDWETRFHYYRRLTYNVNSRKYSAFFNVGFFDYPIGNRLTLEVGMGLGASFQDNSYSGIPENAGLSPKSIIRAYDPDFAITGADIRATGMLYLNIGYVIF